MIFLCPFPLLPLLKGKRRVLEAKGSQEGELERELCMNIFNSKNSKSHRRELRNRATPHEVRLWSRLRRDQLGYRFRRQYGVGRYIVDFYCPEKKLVIEIDGSQHFDATASLYDRARDAFLKSIGCTVLRFTDGEVNAHIEGVLVNINEALHTSSFPPSLSKRGKEGEF